MRTSGQKGCFHGHNPDYCPHARAVAGGGHDHGKDGPAVGVVVVRSKEKDQLPRAVIELSLSETMACLT
ncbi:hypothetical protein L6452_42205 [Arctium lappa]|uniref:Uncharacterized protein n=1 Tax=Arctium lappa TaxID=4217 RepID=A0ACB8XIT4_ARCLA|nr:hypothetical protein L6452_42205 [Arctium lappa]